MIVKWIITIAGMIAVGLLVWRGLERQEAKSHERDSRDDV
jgi:hypothetical protein